MITELEPVLDVFGNSITPTASITRQAQSPDPPVTFCLGGCKGPNEICVGNQNNPQTIDDESENPWPLFICLLWCFIYTDDHETLPHIACAACLDGQTFWPCDVDGRFIVSLIII